MSNIDERVVKMEFDNKAFEKNAGETMSTLDKLKDLLKFDNVNKSFDKLTKAANKVDVSNVSDGIETVNAKLSTMQVVGYTAISNLTNSLVNFGKNAVGKTFGQVVQGGINRAFNIEQAKFTIEGLGKDFVQLKEDINYAVSGTAYGFDEAAKAASMMAASGIEAGDQMKASLRGISGMAAMTGDSYSNIADIFGNIAGKGKLTLQEVNRFATRGINVAAKLAEQFETTEEVVREMVSKGEIDFQTFAKAMDDAFGEHATEANKTFTGVMMNIKATLSRIGEAFVHPLMETNEKDALLLQTYKALNPELVKLAQNSNKAFENNVKARTSLNNAVKDSGKIFGITNEEIKFLVDNNKKAYIKSIKDYEEYAGYTNKQLAEVYKKDQKALTKALSENADYAGKTRKELQDILATGEQQFIEQVKQMDKYSHLNDDQLHNLYEKYTGFQYNITTVLQAFKRMLGTLESAVTSSKFLSLFTEMMSKASEALSLFFNAVAASFTVLKDGTHGLEVTYEKIVNGITKKSTRVVTAEKLWKRFADSIGMTKIDMDNLRDTFSGLSSIVKFFGDIIGSIFKVASSGTGILTSILSVILSITGTIGRLVTGIYNVIDSTKVIQTIASVIHGALSLIIGSLKAVVNAVVEIITKITDNPVFDVIIHLLQTVGSEFAVLFNSIYDVISHIIYLFTVPFKAAGVAMESTGNIITTVLGGIANILWFLDDVLVKSIDFVNSFISNFIDLNKVLKLGNNFADLFKNGFDFSNLFGEKNKGKTDIFGGISKGISKSGGGFLGVLSFIGNAITKAIKKIDFKKIGAIVSNGFKFVADAFLIGLGVLITIIEGLGKVLGSIDYIGIAKGFGAAIGKLAEAMATIIIAVPSFIAGAISEMIKSIPSLETIADKIGEALGNMLANGVRLVLKVIPLIIRIFWNALKVLSTKLPGIIGEFGKELNNIFGNVFTKLLDSMKKISFKDILQALNAAIFYKFLYEAIKLLKVIRQSIDLVGSISRFFSGLGKAARDIGAGIKANLKAQAILMIVGALAALVAMAYVLSKIPTKDLIKGGLAISLFGLLLYEFMKHVNKLGNLDTGMERILAQLSIFLVALTLLVGITALVSKCKTLGQGLAALLYIATGLAAFTAVIGKMKVNVAQFQKISKAYIALSAALLVMAVGLRIIATANPANAIASAVALGIVMSLLATSAILISKFASPEVMKAFSLFGPAILMIAGGLAILSVFNFSTIMGSALAIVAVLSALVGAAALVGNFAPISVGLTALSAAITAFGTAVLMVGGGVYLFVSAMQTLAMLGQSGGLEGLKNSVQSLADCIPILLKGVGDGILILVDTVAQGSARLADAILLILQNILIRLLSAAEMFVDVGIKIITTLLDGILANITKVAATAILIITAFLDVIANNMVPIVESGVNLMVNFINGIANAINTHGEAIWAAVMNLIGQIINLMLTGLQMVVKEIPFIGDDIAKGLDTAKGAIESLFGDGTVAKDAEKEMSAAASAVDKETKSAANSSNKNLSAISKGAKKSAKDTKGSYKGVGKSIVKEFKAVGKGADLSKQMPKMGKETINAYQESIKKNAKPEAGKKAGEKVADGMKDADYKGSGTYAVTGFVNGASSQDMLTKAYNAGYKLGDKADQGIRAALREKSPSKKTEEAGMFAGKGLVNGMAEMAMKVYRAGAAMGSSALEGLRSSMSKMNLDSIDSSPTIRPVLDLSNVKMGVDSINSMFGNSPYALSLAGNMNITSHYDDLQEQNRMQSKNMDKLVSAIADNGLDPDLVYAAVREGAADATLRLNLNGRELSRGLKDLGVKFR